jgi:hypothetical protein
MIKWIPMILSAMVLALALACAPEPPPIRYEILYDRDSGECNVVTRSDNELISESLFHSTIVNECYEYTIENEVK